MFKTKAHEMRCTCMDKENVLKQSHTLHCTFNSANGNFIYFVSLTGSNSVLKNKYDTNYVTAYSVH